MKQHLRDILHSSTNPKSASQDTKVRIVAICKIKDWGCTMNISNISLIISRSVIHNCTLQMGMVCRYLIRVYLLWISYRFSMNRYLLFWTVMPEEYLRLDDSMTCGLLAFLGHCRSQLIPFLNIPEHVKKTNFLFGGVGENFNTFTKLKDKNIL